MSSLALMRWLEGAPERYDVGMRLITFGSVTRLHQSVAAVAVVKPGARVLEIGCGTGSVTALLLARGAVVTALDQSPSMVEQARRRIGSDADVRISWLEQTASEIDGLPEASYDAIVLSLCLSDMSSQERAYVLRECARLLAVGGRLVVADEVHAPTGWRRSAQRLWRFPQAIFAWLLVGTLSRPIANLAGEIDAAGFELQGEQSWLMGSLKRIIAEAKT